MRIVPPACTKEAIELVIDRILEEEFLPDLLLGEKL
jgi:hypothetical protein